MTRAPRRPRDPNQLAKLIVDISTGDAPAESAKVKAGREGGLRGGKGRMAALSPQERKALAKKAARARWKAKS
jgi:hypothetical protein